MGFYDIDFGVQSERLLPPILRHTKWLAWFRSLLAPIQQLHDLIFGSYADSFTGSDWAAGTYTLNQQVKYIDHAIYICTVASTAAVPGSSTDWRLIQDNFIGVRERVKYNSQKLILEYALNKWFETTFNQPTSYAGGTYLPKSDIYIVNTPQNSNVFRAGISDTESSVAVFTEVDAVDYIESDYAFLGTSFTIYIPVAVWTALGANTATRDGAVRAFADQYVLAGVSYTITTY